MAEYEKKNHEIEYTIARIQAKILATILAVIFGLGVFIMTAWLLIKGGPSVGTHLGLLGEYFIGYTVSWTGSFVGLFYGALVGWIIGWIIGIIYNRVVRIRNNS
jgi:hypothetical protein